MKPHRPPTASTTPSTLHGTGGTSAPALRWLAMATSVVAALGLAACASPPAERFHTLRPLPRSQADGPGSAVAPATVTVVVGPVSLPSAVDRPQWVVRTGGTQVRILEQQRWPQDLSDEIGEALVAHLNQSPTEPRLLVFAQTDGAQPLYPGKPAVRVHLNVLRFDSVASPQAQVDDQFQWVVRCTGRPATGQALAQQTGSFASPMQEAPPAPANASVYDRLAAAHAQALGQVSREIGLAVQALLPQCPAP